LQSADWPNPPSCAPADRASHRVGWGRSRVRRVGQDYVHKGSSLRGTSLRSIILGQPGRELDNYDHGQPTGPRAPATDDLKGRIVSSWVALPLNYAFGGSRLPDSRPYSGRHGVFVAHTPNASFAQVITPRSPCAVPFSRNAAHSGTACPEPADAARRSRGIGRGGVEDILLIAGDAPRPIGEFSGTLDILESRI